MKLTAPQGWRPPALDGVVEGVVAVPVETQELDATYYDTSDLRLARSGASLRYRTGEGPSRWTVK
ncbi:MAG: CYTH domain-containing protein, partial [Actinobacteria bacterium]|nr:CYTH domain-containing protein [Actinomycetota bacterium]